MIDNIGALIFVQAIYIIILLLIIWATRGQARKSLFYWCIFILYALILICLIYEYVSFGSKPDPGSVFAWGMLSMIIPGALVFLALVVFILSWIIKRSIAKKHL